MRKITLEQYKEAVKTVELFEKRSQFMRYSSNLVNNIIDNIKGKNYKFIIDKKLKTVTFAGIMHEKELVVGVAKCMDGDVFDVEIGKYIAVCKAVGYDFTNCYEFIEDEETNFHLHQTPTQVFGEDSGIDNVEFYAPKRRDDQERLIARRKPYTS